MSHIATCLNCSAEIRTGPYCERCGQRNVHARLSFRDLVRDVKEQVLEWDLPWLYTLRQVLLHPGAVCREYVDGKRRRYVNPLKYVVYLIPVILVLLGVLPRRYRIYPEFSSNSDLAPTYEGLPFVAEYLLTNPIFLLMLLTPAIALVLRLLYTRDRHNNTEIICWLLYSIGNGMLIALCVHLGFEFFLEHVLNVMQASSAYFRYLGVKIALIGAAVLVHTVVSASSFFREAWYLTWLKIAVVSLVYLGVFMLAMWGLEQTGERTYWWQDEVRPRLSSPLSFNEPWIEQEKNYLAREGDPYLNANYGRFLRIAGRSNDALYRLLLADREEMPAAEAALVATELATAYLGLNRQDFALTQMNRFDTPTLRLLKVEAGMQRGDKDGLPELIRASGVLVDYNLQLAQLWRDNAVEAALNEIRRVTGTAGTPLNQLVMNAKWAALLGDPQLAWSIFQGPQSQANPAVLWQSMWLPYFSEVRKLPAFKEYVRMEGLENYWRTTGNWADQCRALGAADFECF